MSADDRYVTNGKPHRAILDESKGEGRIVFRKANALGRSAKHKALIRITVAPKPKGKDKEP